MPKRDRDAEEDSDPKSNNGDVTIKQEVMSPGGTAPSATTSNNNNVGDRTKDVEELKGMLRTSMDQQAVAEATIETQKATIEKMKKDAEAQRAELQDERYIRCTLQLFERMSPKILAYPHPKLLDIVRQGKVSPALLGAESTPPLSLSAFRIQYVHLSKCSELVDVFKNGLSPQHKLEMYIDAERIAIHVLTRGRDRGQIITNQNKDDFIILGATTRFFSKPLAEVIYDKEWPELAKELWSGRLPHTSPNCKLGVVCHEASGRCRIKNLPDNLQAWISTQPYDAVVKSVHVPKADNPREATECDIDLDRMVVVDVVTKVERYMSFKW